MVRHTANHADDFGRADPEISPNDAGGEPATKPHRSQYYGDREDDRKPQRVIGFVSTNVSFHHYWSRIATGRDGTRRRARHQPKKRSETLRYTPSGTPRRTTTESHGHTMRFTEVLDNDWNHRPPTRHRLTQWAATTKSLDQPVATICTAVTSWTRSTSDAVVQPLMALAAGGDEDACRLLVAALAQRLLPLANRRQNSACQEAFDDLVGYLTEAVISPHPAWTRAYAGQLVHRRTTLASRPPKP